MIAALVWTVGSIASFAGVVLFASGIAEPHHHYEEVSDEKWLADQEPTDGTWR